MQNSSALLSVFPEKVIKINNIGVLFSIHILIGFFDLINVCVMNTEHCGSIFMLIFRYGRLNRYGILLGLLVGQDMLMLTFLGNNCFFYASKHSWSCLTLAKLDFIQLIYRSTFFHRIRIGLAFLKWLMVVF
jgi:hypothetical protein